MAQRKIKTAEEHVADITRLKSRAAREKTEFRRKQEIAERYEYLRDELMSIIKNSGVSDEMIHARCGPTPQTLENWRQKKVGQPRAGKMNAAGRAVGVELRWTPMKGSND